MFIWGIPKHGLEGLIFMLHKNHINLPFVWQKKSSCVLSYFITIQRICNQSSNLVVCDSWFKPYKSKWWSHLYPTPSSIFFDTSISLKSISIYEWDLNKRFIVIHIAKWRWYLGQKKWFVPNKLLLIDNFNLISYEKKTCLSCEIEVVKWNLFVVYTSVYVVYKLDYLP